MRKIISLGLLAVSILTVSTQAFAGYPQCDGDDGSLKKDLQSLGLYGLCNAYWDNEGDPNKQAELREKFLQRADGAFTEIPGEDPPPPPPSSGMSCDCWEGVVLEEIDLYTSPFICFNNFNGISMLFGDPLTTNAPVQRFNYNYSVSDDDGSITESCIYDAYYVDSDGNTVDMTVENHNLGSEKGAVCSSETYQIISTYFADSVACN